jgi:PAS domain S-box-containing protein
MVTAYRRSDGGRKIRSFLLRYFISVITAAIALLFTLLLWPLINPISPPLFLAAIVISAWYGGMRQGLLTTVLSIVTIDYFFINPVHTFFVYDRWTDTAQLIVLLLEGPLFSWLSSKLRAQLDFTAAITNSLAEGVFVVDRDGRAIFMNPAAEQSLGWKLEELRDKNIHEVIHRSRPDGSPYPAEECPVMKVLQTGAPVYVENEVYVRRDGGVFPVSYKASPIISNGQQKGVVQVFRDVTESKLAEEALRRSEARFRRVVDSNMIGIGFWDGGGGISDANEALLRLTGYTREDLLQGKLRWSDMTPEEYSQLDAKAIDFLRELGDHSPFEKEFTRKDGSRVPVLVGGALLEGARNKGVFFALDLSEQKRGEEARKQLLRQLVTAQENERRRISRELHDQMGQHLTALIFGLKLLQSSPQDRQPSESRLSQLLELADRLEREVHHLAWELRPPELDHLGLRAALSNYVEKWSEHCGITADLVSTGMDHRRLPPEVETTVYRVVQEALTNVLKHARARSVSVILEQRPDHVLAVVEDDGRGFNYEETAVTPEGGLGLHGMKERVTLAGGTFDLESGAGAGTTLVIRIPFTAAWDEGHPYEQTSRAHSR